MKYTTLDHNYYYFIIKTSSLPTKPTKKKNLRIHTTLPIYPRFRGARRAMPRSITVTRTEIPE